MSGLGIEGYRVYLARRDGEADLLHRRLANREEFFSALQADPVRSTDPRGPHGEQEASGPGG